MRRSINVRAARNHGQRIDVVSIGILLGQRAQRHDRARAAEVRYDVGGGRHRAGRFALFQGPLLLGRVNDAEIVDASIGLGGLTSFHEIRNRDSRQEADDGHNDHDFNQRKAGLTSIFDCFHFIYFLFGAAVEQNGRRVIYDNIFVHLIVCRNRVDLS
jgi:hypothetical protein